MTTHDENLASYKNTIGKLVSGELKVLPDNEPGPMEVMARDHMERQQEFREAFRQTIQNASDIAARVLGPERIWISRSLSLVISISEIETNPFTPRYITDEGYLELDKPGTPPPDDKLVEHVLNVQAALSFFLHEPASVGKRIGLEALKGSGHALQFCGEGQISPGEFLTKHFIRVPFSLGYIRVLKRES